MNRYHNTNNLTGEDLRIAVEKATKQDEAVRLIYLNTRKRWSASQIHGMLERAGHKMPLTSTRRAITNLFKNKDLVKLSDKRVGMYGEPESYYQLNFIKYPTPELKQQELFA